MAADVSVLMAAYNAGQYIAVTIQSVLAQSYKNFELVIVDDGSTDDTEQIIALFKDDRIKYFKNRQNMGIAYTRNRLVDESKGKYLAILDSDDIAIPDRLKLQRNFLEGHNDFSMVASAVDVIDEHGQLIETWYEKASPNQIPSILFFRNYFSQSSVMINKKYFENMQEAYRKEFGSAEDYDLWIRLAEAGKVFCLPEVLVKYRIHHNNITTLRKEGMKSNMKGIIREQLHKLGLTPSERELTIHYNFGAKQFKTAGVDFKELHHWLVKIINANDQWDMYDPLIFKSVAAEQWFRSVSSYNVFSPRLLFLKEHFFWLRHDKRVLIEKIKFFIKCLIFWKKESKTSYFVS